MPKLTQKQWDKIKQRLDAGESANSISQDYGIHRSMITRRFTHSKVVKELANQIVEVETNLKAATREQQFDAIDLASEIMSINNNTLIGAKHGSITYRHLMTASSKLAAKINHDAVDEEALLMIAKLAETANKAGQGGFNLIAKAEKQRAQDKALVDMTEDDYKRLIKEADARLQAGA